MELKGLKANFLGDSITEGYGVADAENIYLNVLKREYGLAELKKGVFGKYVFFGAEDYLKRFYVGRIRKSVLSGDDTVDSFNHYVIKEEDGDVSDIDAALTSPPMMAEKTLVEIYWDVKNSKFGEKVLELIEFADTDFTVVLLVCPDGGFDGGKKNKPPL